MSREIVLDTETTGLDPKDGHRVVEFAGVELSNGVPTGETCHLYFNPERDMPIEAEQVHGLSISFLEKYPKFVEQIDTLVTFIGDARLIIHNAEFDIRFLNAEFKRAGRSALENNVYCTLIEARKRFPGAPASLDALCRRFGIDLSERTKHGALIDCQLLAKVYLEFLGGQQPGLALATDARADSTYVPRVRPMRPPRPHAPLAEELAAHEALLSKLKNPLWRAAEGADS